MEENQNPTLRFSSKTIHTIYYLRNLKKRRKQVDDGSGIIAHLIEGQYLTKEQLENQKVKEQFLKETENLRAKTPYPERIWKIIGDEIDVFIWDAGNGWSQIISIRDKKGNEL